MIFIDNFDIICIYKLPIFSIDFNYPLCFQVGE